MNVRSATLVMVAALAMTATAAEPRTLEFHRVHVPAGRLEDVPLGGERFVPMPLADFEAAVARARAAADADAVVEPAPPLAAARWRAMIDDSGSLVGTVSCEITAFAAGPGRVMELRRLRAGRAVVAGDPPREVTICGVGTGLAVAIPEPGTYEVEFRREPEADDVAAFRVPLLPALATTFDLDLPAGMRPVLTGSAARRAIVTPPVVSGDAWRIQAGPAAELAFSLEPDEGSSPAVAVWSEIGLTPRRAMFAATIVPTGAWRRGRLVLDQDPALRVTEVRPADSDEPLDHETSADGRSLIVSLPRWCDGSRTPLLMRGVAPATGAVWRLPLVRAASAAGWSGGGMVVTVDAAFAIRDVEFEDCRGVAPETARSWPVPASGTETAAGVEPGAVYHVEQQGPGASLAVTVGPRSATFDVARVTTVDITPNAVLARAACDVRVAGGEVFDISARVAPGWIIDAVDAVDWSAAVDDGTEVARRSSALDRAVDWRVTPSPVGDVLRIALPDRAARERGVGLRITGHRAGLAPGAAFTTADIDMVRFDDEAADAAVIDLRPPADSFVEIGGRPAGWFDVAGRLAPLVEPAKARGRLRGGERTPAVEARLVRRRPPLDVQVDVRLEPRDDSIVQTLTVDCRAAAGVDSLVVDFAAPGGDGFAWRVESPAGIVASARPLDPAEGGLASRSDAIEDSWLVELSPPPTGPFVVRATRTVPFTDAVVVPLAWIEGAVTTGGRVAVAAAAGMRPRLVNTRLRQMPTEPGVEDAAAEFAYDEPQPGAAAQLMPVAAGSDARAWAWRESVSCWCDESGASETESRFTVENEGRAAVSLSLAPGRRLESVIVGGVAAAGVEFGPAGGTWRIPLPPGDRRVEIVVRTLAAVRPGRGAWRVDPLACALDVPVLDRDVRLLLPPGLTVATPGADAEVAGRMSWLHRLCGGAEFVATLSGPTPATGYRSAAVAGLRERGGVLIVRRRLIAGASILSAVLAGIVAFARGRRGVARACLPAVAAGVAALWVPVAFVPIARAAWWGALVGLGCAAWRVVPRRSRSTWWPRLRVAAVITACVLSSSAATASDTGWPVFIEPTAGGTTALVPEPLFRTIAPFAEGQSAAIRTLACRIDAGAAAGRPLWRVELDVDADAGGTLSLNAGPAANWRPPRPVAGMTAAVAGCEARLVAVTPGRHTVELVLEPTVERRGPVEIVTARIPFAPVAVLRTAAGSIACERAVDEGPFTPAPPAADGAAGAAFDVSIADRVRLVQPVDPRDRLATAIRTADSVNDLAWEREACRVDATFDIDAGSDLLRSVIVRVDPRLESIVADGDEPLPRLERLGPGRISVEFREPVRGRTRVGLAARMPLADPVGVFDLPDMWLEAVPAETRTVTLAAAAEFDALIDPPAPVAALAADVAGRPLTRVIVRRRRGQVNATQALAVTFAPEGVALNLTARIDAQTAALARIPIDVPVGSAVDRVALISCGPTRTDDSVAVDIEWTRVAPDRLLVVVQRPQPGLFQLDVEARLERRPASRGRLPLVQARLGGGDPLAISWSAVSPLRVAVEATGPGTPEVVEVGSGAMEPEYVLTTVGDEPEADPAPVVPTVDDAGSRVEWVEVHAAFDLRGRVHGVARFDVVTPAPVVRLRLPPGMRLFDVLVDGRVAAAEPRAADAWDVPLGAADWPRTILAVFAGDAGSALGDGQPLELAAPRLDGLAAVEVLWRLRSPPGCDLKIAPPARPLDATALETARSAALERIAAVCDRAATGARESERPRLEALAALRRDHEGLAAEDAWLDAAGWDGSAPASTLDIAAAEPLVIRAAPTADRTAPARATATVALVAAAGIVWIVAGRGRAGRDRG